MITLSRSVSRSQQLLERARELIPGASQTLSKGPSQWVQGVAPTFLERAEGAYAWDVDGNRYLDLPAALGPILLGHCHPAVDRAIVEQLWNGITFTLPHRLEIELAERIVAMVPGVEQVRFAKSGSDATTAAVRLARIHTGREQVIATGYHGWHDWYMATAEWRGGIPRALDKLTWKVPFGDLDRLEGWFKYHPGEIACVILEPAGLTAPSPAFLQEMVDLIHAHGALVIFDEVITGFRLAPGGAQEHFGVQADLVCFGKALGNGMPISAVAGRAEIMKDISFLSFTHAGETLSLAAACATLDVLASEPVHDHLWKLGQHLKDGVNTAIHEYGLSDVVECSGLAPRSIVTIREPRGDLLARSLLQQELIKRGVLFNGNNFISYAHTYADIEFAIRAYGEALAALAAAWPHDLAARLEGPPIAPVFRKP